MVPNSKRSIERSFWLELLIVVALAVVAVFLRYYQIGQVPPGFNSDEAVGAVGALQTVRGGLRLYYEGQGGGGALGFYIAAIAFALFGPSIAAIRGTAAFAGVVSVIATYFLVREMFRTENDPTPDNPAGTRRSLNRARLLAALATLGLATSLWHVQSSRVAFAAIGVPFLQVPAIYFLWRGLNTGRRLPFILSGVLLASVSFIYMSGAFAPVVFLAFFLLQWAIAKMPALRWHASSAGTRQTVLLTSHFRNLLICVVVAFVCLLPMIYFYLSAPDLATHRAQQALFTNPLINQGDPWGTLWRSLWGNLAAFGLSLSWLQGQPPHNLILPLPMTLLFLLGFAVSLWRIRRPAYLFALLSWLVMLVPSILSPDSIPHAARAMGASPFAYILVAIGMLSVADVLAYCVLRIAYPKDTECTKYAIRNTLLTAAALLAVWLTLTPTLLRSFRYYFVEWPQTNDAQAAFHVYAVDLAADMSRETNPRAVFLLPRDTAAGDINPNFTVMFLYSGQAGYVWVVDDERTIEKTLSEAVAGRDVVHVVHWKTSKHTGADPKEIIRYYLEKHGHYVSTDKSRYYDIDTYQMGQPGADLTDQALTPAALDFGGAIRLTGYGFGDASPEGTSRRDIPKGHRRADVQTCGSGLTNERSVPAGDLVWAHMRVRLLQPVQDNLKLSVMISDSAGHTVGQIDKLLLNNILHQPTSQWQPATETEVYFLVPVAPATAPGSYNLQAAVYGTRSPLRLALSGSDDAARVADLGTLAIRPDLAPPGLEALHMAQTLDQATPVGLTLLGFTAPDNPLRPGDQTSLALVWRADMALSKDYHAEVWVVRDGKGWPITPPLPLAGIDYPTSRWTAGQVVRGWLDARLPRDLINGEYKLGVRLLDEGSTPLTEIPLGALQVAGWTRSFDIPQPQYALHANFGAQIELLGYDLKLPAPLRTPVSLRERQGTTGSASPDPEVVLYWRAISQMDVNYTTFVHILDEVGQVVAQVDHVPGDGAFPTTGWLAGEVIADRFVVPLPADRLHAVRQIEAGIYDPATMERLPTLDQSGKQTDTRVLLPLETRE